MTPPADLTSGSIWQATIGALRADFGTLFAVAAPFTLLVSMLVTLYGPPPPEKLADLTLRTVVLWNLVPALVATIGQLAIVRLVVRPEEAPRTALAAAFAVLPVSTAALLLSGVASGLGALLFIVPGLYISARLFPLVAVAAIEGGDIGTMLRRCWDMTDGRGLALLWFLLLAVGFLLFATILIGGASAAISAAATLLGLAPIGHFLSALADAALRTFGAMAYAAAAAVVYLRLVPAAR